MKIFRIAISSDNGIQAIVDLPPEELLYRDLYTPYPFDYIDSIRLDLDRSRKLTDVLNVGNLSLDGLLIKNKFIPLLNELNLLEIQFIEVIDEKIIDYSFMFFNCDITHKLDYEKSNFILIDDFFEEIEIIDENLEQNREILIELAKNNAGSDYKIIPKNGYHFIDGFNIFAYDVFRIGQFNDNFYISERVKNTLEENNITGLDFFEETLFNLNGNTNHF